MMAIAPFSTAIRTKGRAHIGHDYAEWLRAQDMNPDELLAEYSLNTYQAGATVKGFGGVYVPTEDDDNVPPASAPDALVY